MIEQPMRAIAECEAVYPAHEIPIKRFGRTEMTKRVRQGAVVAVITEIIAHVFRLNSCGCRVTRPEHCGGTCVCCLAELDQQRHEGVVPNSVSLEQLEWMATPCKEHYFICAYELCSHGLCPKHAAPTPDGQFFCPLHIGPVTYELELNDRKRERGLLYAKGHEFVRGLFFDKHLRR